MSRFAQPVQAGARFPRITILVGLACFVAAQPALAAGAGKGPPAPPSSAGDLTGTVHDGSGLPLVGALIAVILPDGGRALTVSGARGRFVVEDLPAGVYTLMAQSLGFVSAILPGIVVPLHEPLKLQLRPEQDLSVLSADAPLDLGWAFRPRVRDVLRMTDPTSVPEVVGTLDPAMGPGPRGTGTGNAGDRFSLGNLDTELKLWTVASGDASGDSGATTDLAVSSQRGGAQSWNLQAQMAGAGLVRAKSDIRRFVGDSHTLRLDVGYAGDDLTLSELNGEGEHIWVGSVAAEDSWRLSEPFMVSYGLRVEHYNYLEVPGLVSPRVEVAYAPVKSLILRTGVSYDAEAPGSSELQLEFDPLAVRYMDVLTTEEIEAERELRYEFGLEKTTSTTKIKARAYWGEVNDELVGIYAAGPRGRSNYKVYNLGDAVNRGFEVDLHRSFMEHLAGQFSYAYGKRSGANLPTDLITDEGLVAPSVVGEQGAGVGITHELRAGIETVVGSYRTRLRATYRWKLGVPVVRGGSFDDVHERLDLRVRQPLPFLRALASDWSATVQVQNVLGQDYDGIFDPDFNNFPVLSRLVAGGLAIRF
ncbi:MAG: TonB-dependent receptor domain-containing protein [Acidobacteriota bacterium]